MTSLAPRPARTRLAAAAFAVLAAFALTLPAGAAHADSPDDATWTVRTASNSFGAERTSYSYTVNPGSTTEDALVIANHGTAALELGVYAADGFTTTSGQFDLVVGGAKSVNVGAWVKGASAHVTVAPGATVEYPFTLRVPANASPGDYAGGIVTSLVEPDQQQGINVDRRLGIRMAVRVSGDLKPALAVENFHVGWDGGLNPFAGGDATVSYTIHNTGNAILSAKQTAAVTGPFGLFPRSAASVKAPPQLLPGEKWQVSIPVRDVPAFVVLTANATVTPMATDASGSTTALAPVTASTLGLAVPWGLLVLIAVLVALVFGALWLRRRMLATQKAREDARVADAISRALGAPDASTPSASTPSTSTSSA